MGSRGEGRAKEKENNFFLKIYEDQLGSKLEQQPFPSNGARNACWYFLTFTDKIHMRTEDTIVALHPESIQGIVFSQGTEVNDLLASVTQENKK